MRTYVAKRLLLIVPTLLGVASLVFVIMRVIPGDVTLLILGGDQAGRIDPAQVAAMKRRLGIDQPLLVQFGTWLWGVLRFDFGTSLWSGRPVVEELLIRLPLSLELAFAATLVSVLIAIPCGMLSAVRQDTWVDYVRSEEHTSELQSHSDLVCRLLLEKKKKRSYMGLAVYLSAWPWFDEARGGRRDGTHPMAATAVVAIAGDEKSANVDVGNVLGP